MKELIDCNTQTIAQLLDSGHCCTVISAANYIINGRLCNAANAT